MQRTVFERSVVDGFRVSRVESLVCSNQGKKIFAATADGAITAYTLSMESNSAGRIYTCKDPDMFRKPSKDKKSVAPLVVAESWRVVLCIADGVLTSYDTQFHTLRHAMNDNKGISLFSIYAQVGSDSVVTVNKKKLSWYAFKSDVGFILQREFNLSDTPKSLHYITAHIAIVGYKKYYEVWDVLSGSCHRLLDIEKEHKNTVVTLPLPPPNTSITTPPSAFSPFLFLFTVGSNGIILDLDQITAGHPITNPTATQPTTHTYPALPAPGSRVEWSPTSPLQGALFMPPFLIAQGGEFNLEITELGNFVCLQKFALPPQSGASQSKGDGSGLSACMCVDEYDLVRRGERYISGLLYHVLVCNGEQLFALRMTSLSAQINHLVSMTHFDIAVSLPALCPLSSELKDIDISRLHENCANALVSKGDFERGVRHFVWGGRDFGGVARLFPDFIPLPLQVLLNISQTKKLVGGALQRAASAVIILCEHHRDKILRRAERAERVRDRGIIGMKASARGAEDEEDDEDDYIADPDECVSRAVLLDSMLCHAYLSSGHAQTKSRLLALLSSKNRCHLESCSVLLASHGNAYTDCLLWLFRSQGQHAKVLQALDEDKCVAVGSWSRDQFYQWVADYLRFLWYQEDDTSLPRLVLGSLGSLLQYDAELGLSVLVNRPASKTSFGGKGVTISEVLSFLRASSPKINYTRGMSFQRNHSSALRNLPANASAMDRVIAGVLSSLPLINGLALCVAFLECLVSSGEAPAGLHDDFAQLLIDGILASPGATDPALSSTIEIKSDDPEEVLLPKIFRRKLQVFLMTSVFFHPQKIVKALPEEYLVEHALLQGKMGKHRDVLEIYIRSLNRPDLAEVYCDKIYVAYKSPEQFSLAAAKPAATSTASGNKNPASGPSVSVVPVAVASNLANTLRSASEIYIIFFQVILDDDDEGSAKKKSLRVSAAIALAEKYFDRFDTASFLELLPKSIPIAKLQHYLMTVMEYNNAKRRNLQILHNLLRVKEVAIRTPDFVYTPSAAK